MSKRIEYIDAIRGLTMLLVVINHIEVFCFGNRIPSYSPYFSDFRMPLFFFISGWVLYKENFIWNFQNTFNFLKKKFLIQIIPTAFFLCLFLHIIGSITQGPWILDMGKNGYWFTYVLFEYFTFYAFFNLFLRKLNNKMNTAFLVVFSFFIYFLSTERLESLINNPSIYGFLSVHYWRFFPFFIIGTFVKKYFDRFNQLMDNKWIMLFLILLAIVLYPNHFILSSINKTLYFFISALCGIFLILTVFRKNEKYFKSDKILGRSLQFIGRRTLDIYLIHYLFLPRNFHMIGGFFKTNINYPIEYITAMAFAIIVIAFSLLLSFILRQSDILKKYLFGVKK